MINPESKAMKSWAQDAVEQCIPIWKEMAVVNRTNYEIETSKLMKDAAQIALDQCADLAEKLIKEGLADRIPDAIRSMTP